jgi:hypothetical protein
MGNNPLMNGMMVLPVQGLPGDKKAKKKAAKKAKKGKGGKGGGGGGGGDVQVNLIVDPNVFGRREQEESDEDEDDWEGSVPGGYAGSNSARRNQRRRPPPKRRSVFAGLAMEEEWKKARAWLKKIAVVDGAGIVVWGAVFVFIMLGKRCPSGGFEGWSVQSSLSFPSVQN